MQIISYSLKQKMQPNFKSIYMIKPQGRLKQQIKQCIGVSYMIHNQIYR